MELYGKAALNFNETAAAPKRLFFLIDHLVVKSLFYIIGEMFMTNELFVDSVAS